MSTLTSQSRRSCWTATVTVTERQPPTPSSRTRRTLVTAKLASASVEARVRTGGCLCGAVRYSVRGDPVHVRRCHCADCRKESGSAFSVYAHWPIEAFELTGEISSYDGRGFCPRCGSRLLDTADPDDTFIEIRLGSLDEAPFELKPDDEIWVERRGSRAPPGEGAAQRDEKRETAPLRGGRRRGRGGGGGGLRRVGGAAQRDERRESPPVREARLEALGSGVTPVTRGCFVVTVRDAEWWSSESGGGGCAFENEYGDPPVEFGQLGINVTILEPGQTNLYHAEVNQEAFLVLSGECALVVEDEERRLRPWDFFHAPPWTEHAFVGGGEGPCVILMVGSRSGPGVHYPVSELAARHGASVAEETSEWRQAYATLERFRRERPPNWARLPWA